jgi:hypothetical protein
MPLRLFALIVTILAFGALTTVALFDVGFIGIIEGELSGWGHRQVFADLVIACILGCFWMAGDAPKRGLPAWPFIVITLLAGSFGILFYLVARELRKQQGGNAAATSR